MTLLIFIILSVVIIGFVLVIYFLNRKFKDLIERQKSDQSLLLLNQNIQGMQARIDNTTRAIGERLDCATRVISGVSKELGQVQEIGREMRSLQEFLHSPKIRGNIGEQVLRDLLEQYFSREHFGLQYKFREGQIVDAILKTDKGLIPIDAKFPLENFQRLLKTQSEKEKEAALREFRRDVKKHIDDISRKYILPEEGTVDFAIMYVPNEAVYYEIVRDEKDLNTYGYQKKVFIVSPNSFYYFLKVLMIGMEGKRIEEASRRILKTLNAIQKDATRFGENLGILTTHITNAKQALDRVNNEYAKLSGKIDQVKLLK